MHPPPCQATAAQRTLRPQTLFSSPERLLWAVWVRWLVIGGFLGLAVVAHTLGLFASIAPCVRAALVGCVLNGVNQWCVRHRRHVIAVTAIAIPLDHVLITYVVAQTGGVRSPFVMMYVVQVLATAMLVATSVAALSATCALLAWLAAVSLQAGGRLAVAPSADPGATSPVEYQVMWAVFLLYCLALLVYLGGYISERLRASERDLEEQNRRLEDALASACAAYERLKRTEAHLIQSEKLRGLGQLVAGVAHELNNPISFVAANVEYVRSAVSRLRLALDAYARAPLPADARAFLANVRDQLRIDQALADLPGLLDDCEEGARRTAQIVTALQRFSRSDAHEAWQRSDIHRGIESTLALLAHRFKDRITVHRDFGDLPDIECLPGQLNQVFMNLLANAGDAIGPTGGNVWILTRTCALGAVPERAEPSVVVVIRDDGCGMPPEVQGRIFDPFFTTKDVGQGSGLGLSVSHGIVQRHRGTLAVQSVLASGSAFILTLPVRQTQNP